MKTPPAKLATNRCTSAIKYNTQGKSIATERGQVAQILTFLIHTFAVGYRTASIVLPQKGEKKFLDLDKK